jgi:imidazole glycerol phosphate synthase subunit HisF
VAISSLFHYQDLSIGELKKHLANAGLDIRLV